MKEQLLKGLLKALDDQIDVYAVQRQQMIDGGTGNVAHLESLVDGLDEAHGLVEKVFEQQGHLLDDAHKRNTALMVELNELCQQQGIGRIGDSVVTALKTYIKNIQGTLDLTERLILSEIGDFTASLPGGPVTSVDAAQLQQDLIARAQRVFADVRLQAGGK